MKFIYMSNLQFIMYILDLS